MDLIPTKIFIIPYRNRTEDKNLFDKHMKYILEDIPNTYKIFFVHQNDSKPFNRGAMKNIGFLAMRDKYPDNYKDITFIFNDIDTYPVNKNVLNFDTTRGTIKHFYGFTFALGGIFSITGHDFENCGGFPNYWGWGLEDAVIQKAALAAKIAINRDNFFVFRDAKNIVQRENITQRLTTKKEPWRFVNNDINETYRDIQNLQYHIENEYIQVTNFTAKFLPSSDRYYVHNISKGPAPLDPKFGQLTNKNTSSMNNLIENPSQINTQFKMFNNIPNIRPLTQKTKMNMMFRY